jgi:O-antigen/teichoic acid export membrane protein
MPASSKELADTAPGNSTKRAARRSIFGNGARVMGVNWIETALGAIYFAVMARCLGPILYGYWAYGIATYTLLVGLAGFGLDILILLHLGRDKEGAADFVGVTLTLRLGLLGFAAIGLAAYALVAEAEPATRLVLLLLVPALAGRGVALWARTCFLAYERMADYARFAALFRIAEAGCGISYLAAGGGLLGVVVLHSLFWFGEGSFGLWRIRSRLTGFALHLDWRFATDLLAQGAILGLATAAYAWLTTGPIMLLRYGGIAMAQVGQFAIVMSLTMILVGSAEAFCSAALPVLSRSARLAAIGMAYGRLTALAIAAATLGAAALAWAIGPSVAAWALGARYAVAGGLLGPFLLIGGLILLPIGYFQLLLVSGRRWPEAVANLAGAFWLAISLVPAATAWDLYGAIIATASAWLVRGVILITWGELHGARERRAGALMPVLPPKNDGLDVRLISRWVFFPRSSE